jgi:hypothetical protein
MPGGFKYPSSSDIDPNVVDLLYRAIKPKLDSLIDDRQQRRQVWGPTFKQEGIREIPIADADYIVPAPEYGKRTLMFAGALTAQRTIQLPSLSGAWWIVRNNTPKNLKFIAGVAGTVGPIIASGDTGAVFTDGVTVWLFPTLTQDVVSDDWKWSTATSGAPASGYIQANNADPALVTELSISETSQSGDAVPALDQLVPGSVIYVQDKDDGTKWARYEVSGAVVDAGTYRTIPVTYLDSAGVIANDEVVTVQISTGSSGGGGGGGGGALPDGIGSEVQARAGPTTFKRVSYSITSDQHVSFAGQLSVTLPPPLHTEARILLDCTDQHSRMVFTKYLTTGEPVLIEMSRANGTSALPADIGDGEAVGRLHFKGRVGGTFETIGYLDARWYAVQESVMILGAGPWGVTGGASVGISETGAVGSAGLYAGTHYFQTQTYGHLLSGGQTGAMWYQAPEAGGISYYVPLDIDPALDNGKVLTVVETGPSTGIFLPKWMPPPGGSGGGAPGLPDWSLQYRVNATTFGGVTSSIVTGANIVLGGELAFHNVASTDQHVRINATGSDPAILMAKFGLPPGGPLFFIRRGRGTNALPEPLGAGDYIGAMLFQGYDGADFTTHGYWRTGIDSVGSVTELGAGPFDQALIRITHNPLSSSAGLIAGTNEWRVQSDGLVSSYGQTGSMLYKAPGGAGSPSVGYMWDLPIGEEGQVLTVAESTHPTFGDYLHPKWAAPSTGALPEGDFHELQSRWDATTFKRVLNSEVTGANIKLAGNLAFSDTLDHRIDFRRTTTPGASDYVGSIWFQVAGHLPDDNVAVLRCLNTSAGYVADFALAAANRVYIGEDATGLEWSPTRYIQFQSEGIRLSGGALGSIFYQETHGGANLYFDPLLIGAANTYLKSDGTRPVWAVLPAGTVTSPGGSVPQLQFHQTGGIFGGITGSSTDGTNVWLTGFLNVNQQVILNEAPAYVTFRGDAGATVYGFVRGFGSAGAGVMELACSPIDTGPRVQVQQIGTVGLFAGTNFFSVHTDGTLMKIGNRGSLYFKGDLDYLVPLDILGTVPAPVYLKATGDLPFWATLGWGDISGVVPISKGGTGTGTAPGPGYLLIGKADGSYVPAILTEDTGILITEGDGTITIKCTVTPGTGATPPGGSQTQIQFHNTSDEFGGIAGSLVDTLGNITLGGNVTITSTAGRELYFNRTTNVTGVVGGSLGQIAFRDGSTAVDAPKAFIRAYWTNVFSAGYVLELYRTDARRLYITDIGAQMDWDGKFFQIVAGGIRVSGGSIGCVFIQDSNNYHVGLPAPLVTGQFLKSDGGLPYWADAPSGPGGATPGGGQGQIQYNNSSTFAGIGNYTSNSFEVAPASGPPNLVLAGGFFQIVPSISGTIPTRLPNQDQEFFISATMAAPTRFVMRRYSNQPNDSSSIDGRLGGYIRFDKGRGTAAIPEDIANGDQMGQITWWGRTGGALAQMGHIMTYFNAGGVLRLAAKAGGYAFIDIREGTVPATDNSITLYTASQSHFFQVLNAGFRISIGTVGAVYYQSHTGSQTQLVELNSSSGAVGNVLTLVSGFATEAGSLVPRWQAPAGGPGGSPGTPANSLQWNNGSTFDGVENSIVTTGGLVTLGEQSDSTNNAVLTLQKTRAGNVDLSNGHSVGRILFQGKIGSMQDFGVLEGLYNTTPLKTLRLGQGLSGSAYRVIGLKDNGEIYLEVSNGSQITNLKLIATGMILTPGTGAATNFGTYVRDGSGNIVTVGPGGVGTYLRSSTTSAVPSWQALAFSDFTSGTLPVARGGTNLGSTPSNGALLIGNGTGYSLNQLVGAGGITISYPSAGNITITQTAGSVSAPLTLTLNSTTNNPTFTVDHTQSGSGTITDVYGERFWFRMSHSGAVSGSGGRKGVSMTWDHTNSGSGSVSTDGDTILQLFAQNTGSLGLSSYKLSALTIDGYLPANYGTFTGIRIKGMNATTRRAIMCDYGSGDVVINAGTQLSPSSTWGFLYISAVSSGPSSGSINSIVPVGTCAVVWDYNLKRVCFNDGTGWRYITMTGSF